MSGYQRHSHMVAARILTTNFSTEVATRKDSDILLLQQRAREFGVTDGRVGP